MKRLSQALTRDAWLALALFLLLVLFTTITVVQQAQASLQQPPLASFSTQPNGSQALSRFLESQNIKRIESVSPTFSVPTGVDLALVLEPTVMFSTGEWEILRRWVADGGSLLIAGNEQGTSSLAQQLEISFGLVPSANTAVSNQTPLLQSPPLAELTTDTPYFLRTTQDEQVTLLANQSGQPAALVFAEGNGRIILTSLTEPFSNEGLQTPGNAELVLNLMSAAPNLETVWFDEWHHGVRPAADAALASNNWLQRTPVGQSLLLALAIVFLSLVLRGRRFGRPVPLPQAITRRAPLEYISGIANLSRRAGHRTAVLQHYHDRLKRDLGQRYRLNPNLPDDEFIAQLATYQPNLDRAALGQLLQKLSQTKVSETEMVQIVREAALFGNR